MKLTREKIKHLAVLFILLIIFQLILGIHIYNECLNPYEDTSLYFQSQNIFQTEVAFFNLSSRKTVDDLMLSKAYDGTVEQSYFTDITASNLICCISISDNRSEIKKSIPHHFNGSKYKDCSLFI